MDKLRDHLFHAALSALVATAAAAAVLHYTPRKIEQITQHFAATKHAWPALSDAEKSALAAVLATLPKSAKFDIVCNTASCDDLAEDIDDAMEAAGLQSGLDHAVGPLGYGIGVMVNAADKDAAQQAIAALSKATNGRLDPALSIAARGGNPPGTVTILIGKYRAP